MKGKMPSSGKIFFRNNKMECINIILNDKKFYPPGKLVDDVDNNKKISIGDKYTYEVKDNNIFEFYVLSINTDNTVNLIMNRNICENGNTTGNCSYGWHSTHNNNYGPSRAMTKLYNATKDWDNVPDMIMNYKDENNKNNDTLGYESVITNPDTKITTITGKNGATNTMFGDINAPLKARLPMYSEVNKLGCKVNVRNTCPIWLIENSGTYWLMSSEGNTEKALHTLATSETTGQIAAYCCAGSNKSIRPVITVSIDDLSN